MLDAPNQPLYVIDSMRHEAVEWAREELDAAPGGADKTPRRRASPELVAQGLNALCRELDDLTGTRGETASAAVPSLPHELPCGGKSFGARAYERRER